MVRLVVACSFLLITSGVAQAECGLPSDPLGARYEVTVSSPADAQAKTYELILWRDGRRVAHEYPATRITEVWEQTTNQTVRLVRHFDSHSRGIEYQPGEIQGNRDWGLKRYLIAESYRNSLQQTKRSGDGCELTVHYSWDRDGVHVGLRWRPALQLVETYTEHRGQHGQSWKLKEVIHEPARIDAAFAKRDRYQTTDYTDIGDNESDPFLMNMIRLGFVEHGASGFYDEHGHALDGHGH